MLISRTPIDHQYKNIITQAKLLNKVEIKKFPSVKYTEASKNDLLGKAVTDAREKDSALGRA